MWNEINDKIIQDNQEIVQELGIDEYWIKPVQSWRDFWWLWWTLYKKFKTNKKCLLQNFYENQTGLIKYYLDGFMQENLIEDQSRFQDFALDRNMLLHYALLDKNYKLKLDTWDLLLNQAEKIVPLITKKVNII